MTKKVPEISPQPSPQAASSASGATPTSASRSGTSVGATSEARTKGQAQPSAAQPSAAQPSAAKPPAAQKNQDVVLIHGVTDDQKGLKVLRARNDGLELGEVRPLVEGQAINHDVVRLKPRQGAPHVCDVETEISAQELAEQQGARLRSGPAKVSSPAYRNNWDLIWAKKPSPAGSTELN